MNSEFNLETKPFQVIPVIQDPAIDYQAALYFLDGEYLFRHKSGQGWAAKFVTAADVAAAFTGAEQDSGWLPAGVVRAGSNARGKWFVYSAPPQKAKILFDGEEEPISIPLPRTVLVGVGSNYYLWAMKGEHFDRSGGAHAAPFPNVHHNGQICWGASTPPAADPGKARKVWELFFYTPFNNHLVEKKSRAFPEDVRQQLRGLGLAEVRKYPVDDLAYCGTHIGGVIESALGVR